MADLIDSYSESHQNANDQTDSGTSHYAGQSFYGLLSTNSYVLDSAKFFLKKIGSPTGNAVVKVFAITGSYGTTSKPTGSALATSDNFDVSTLSTSYGLVTFTFSGANRIILAQGTQYCLEVFFTGGDNSNAVQEGFDNAGSHAGNMNDDDGSGNFTAYAGFDMCFYVYGLVSTLITAPLANLNIQGLVPTIQISGGWTYENQDTSVYSNLAKDTSTYTNLVKDTSNWSYLTED